jgi:hypothetical protein
MSRIQEQQLKCPKCGDPVAFEVIFSINADRRPDLRKAILDNTIQRGKCGKCGSEFRIDPELTYFDARRKQWILVKPAAALENWIELEQDAASAFELAYGKGAAAPARAIGQDIQARVTFGWPALREKLFCVDNKIDDVSLELMKLAIIRGVDDVPWNDDVELRLVELQGDQMKLAWISAATGQAAEVLVVPRSLYDEIAADKKDWQPLRQEVSAATFVDVHRLLVPQEKEEALEEGS